MIFSYIVSSMKILFLHENYIEESLGVASLSAVLKAAGHECDVLIEQAEGKDFLKKILSSRPGLIAFSCSTGRHVWANKTAGEIRRIMDVPILMGGIHPTLYPEQAIAEENMDMICRGEGEYPLLELADRIEAGQGISGIENLWVKQGRRIIKNEIRPLNDLNQLPYPDRALYYKYAYNRDLPSKRFMSGMGCPFSCSFCHNNLLRRLYRGKGPYVRRKSVDYIIAEILEVKRQVPLELVHFSDDLFVSDRRWLEDFSAAYRRQVALPFNGNVRIADIDEHKATLLRQAGCHAVTFGLECANEFLRNRVIRKELPDEAIRRNTVLLKKKRIRILTTNMLGLPHEKLDDIYATIRLNRQIKTDYVRVFMTKPHQKTDLFEYGRRSGLLTEAAFNNDHYSDLENVYFRIPHAREARNLRWLFYLIMKFPILEIPSRFLIRCRLEGLYRWMFFLTTALQERHFFRIGLMSGIRAGLRLRPARGRHF